ncbi:11315_t:CDS:2 [Ambispora leptoticha]|uniref:11315_t:CDS:1 n=1 Tax=Ambispora leptoticha TaxID=144679 RepID=A0A9N8Z229_9GLOM|nr:11315_t:CDS:2 [Ambispora leptoticha]
MFQTKLYIYLKEIFPRYRHIEPKSIVICRGISALLILALLTTFTAFLIIDILDDGPVLQKTIFTADSLPIPDILITSNYQFKIECLSIKLTTKQDCTLYINQPVVTTEKKWKTLVSLDQIAGRFAPKDLSSIGLSFTPNDNTFDPIKSEGYIIEAYDPEFGPYSNKPSSDLDGDELNFYNTYGQQFTYSLGALNNYFVLTGTFAFSRTIKEIISQTQSNTFGIPASYSKQTYITSDYELVNHKLNNEASLIILPRSYMIERLREQRTKTFLGALALFGGIWVIAAGVYACLFGINALRPWGLVHSCCFPNDNRKHILNRYPNIPLFSPAANSNPTVVNNFGTDDEFKRRMEERFNALELFLKDHVVNAGYLEEFVKNANDDNQPLSDVASTLPANVISNSVKINNDPSNISMAYPNDLPVYGAPSQMTYPPQVAHNIQPMNMQVYGS